MAGKTLLFRFFDASIGNVDGKTVLIDKFDRKTLVDNIGDSFNVELPIHELTDTTKLRMRQCKFNIDTLPHEDKLDSEITTYLLKLESQNKFKGFFTCSDTGMQSLCYPFADENKYSLKLFAKKSIYVFFTIIDNLDIQKYVFDDNTNKHIEEHNFDGLLNSSEFRSKLSIPSGHDVQKTNINTIRTSGYCVNGMTVSVSEKDEKTHGHLAEDVKATCKIDITGSIDIHKINVLALGKLMPEPNLHEINFTGKFGINGYLIDLHEISDGSTDDKVYGTNMVLYSILSGLLVENGEDHTISKINNGGGSIQLPASLSDDLKRIITRRYNNDGRKIIQTLNKYNIDTTELNAYYTGLRADAAAASAAKREQLREEEAERAAKKAAVEARRALYSGSVGKGKQTKEETYKKYYDLLGKVKTKLDSAFPSDLINFTIADKKEKARELIKKLRKLDMALRTNFNATDPPTLIKTNANKDTINKLITEFATISQQIDENLQEYNANKLMSRSVSMSGATSRATHMATPMATNRHMASMSGATHRATPMATPMAITHGLASMSGATPRATPMATNRSGDTNASSRKKTRHTSNISNASNPTQKKSRIRTSSEN